MEQTIANALDILQSKKLSYAAKRERISGCFNVSGFKELIEWYENEASTVPRNEAPRFTFVFYLILVFMYLDELDEIANYIKGRASAKDLIIGAGIFLAAKSGKLRYGVTLNDKYFSNKLEYVLRSAGNLLEPNTIYWYVLKLLELIALVDKKQFLDVIKNDRQNLFFIAFFTETGIDFDDKDIIFLLNLDDELRINAVLYYLTRKFRNYISAYQSSQDEENINNLNNEIERLYTVFASLDPELAVYLIVNYVFAQNEFPNFFFDVLEKTDKKYVIKNLENQDLNNLYKLVHIRPLIQELKYLEVESLFIKNLLAFMLDKVNADIWNEVSHEVISIIKELHTSSKEILRKELREAKRSLCLSSFDRQVRALIYNRDMAKKSIIDEIEENL